MKRSFFLLTFLHIPYIIKAANETISSSTTVSLSSNTPELVISEISFSTPIFLTSSKSKIETFPSSSNSDSITKTTTKSSVAFSEACDSYYDFNDNLVRSESCSAEIPFCCGSCSRRSCCGNQTRRLDQSKCAEKCFSYIINSNWQILKNCDTELFPYCCGSCVERKCCK